MQEAGDTLDLRGWVKVVQTAKGQSQRGSKHHVPQQQTTSSPKFNSDHVPFKVIQSHILSYFFYPFSRLHPDPGTHLLPQGPLGTRRPGFSILRGLGLQMRDGPWVLSLEGETNTFIIGLAAPRTIMRGKEDIFGRTRRVGIRMFGSLYAEGPPV